MEVDHYWVNYTNKLPKGDYLIFPISGYTVSMRNVGVPNVIDSSNQKYDVIRIRYDFDSSIGRGDNRYPRVGDQLGWIVELPDYSKDIKSLQKEIEKLKEVSDGKRKVHKSSGSSKA